MLELQFYNEAERAGFASPAIALQPTSPIPSDFIEWDDFEDVRPTFWGEHCVECSEPLCFENCSRYAPRSDGKCRRFAFGIHELSFPEFDKAPYQAEIAFLPWGKLETPIYSAPMNPEREATIRNQYHEISHNALIRAENEGASDSNFYAELFAKGDWAIKNALSEDDLGKSTSHFVLQLYSYNEQEWSLHFELTSLERLAHHESFVVRPGYNQFIVELPLSTPPLRNLNGSQKAMYARLIPEGDFAAHFVLLMAEFVNFKKDIDLASAQESGKNEPATSGADETMPLPLAPDKKVKCVCWDLDNTLWEGILIESDPQALTLREGVLETMQELDARGIVQAIVSKNQEEDVRPVLKRLGVEDLFVCMFINWNSKSQNIKQVARILNIGIDSLAFIDDQPFERAEVQESIPCVRVYDETCVPALLETEPFDVPRTQDGAKRRIMYKEELERRILKESFSGSNIDFLRSCNLEIELSFPDTPEKCQRSFELVQRTNQLNLSGRRYEKTQFMALLDGWTGKHCVCVSCKDRFGSYGQVGYMVLSLERKHLVVSEFAMSCRVMGKCVENAFAAWLKELARELEACDVRFRGLRSARNGLLVKTLTAAGFEDMGIFENDILLSLPVSKSVALNDVVSLVDEWSHKGVQELKNAPDLGGSDADMLPFEPHEAFVFVPHQDDELLTCGLGVVESLERFRGRVAVVLLTDGRNCCSRLTLSDGGTCPDLGDEHLYELDAQTFGKCRDTEFIASCKKLGVQESAILLPENRAEDGTLTPSVAKSIIERCLDSYPYAKVITHSRINMEELPEGLPPQHSDHQAVAAAALDLYEQKRISKLEMFVEFYHLDLFAHRYPDVRLIKRAALGERAERLVEAACEYARWEPENERFACGMHSVRTENLYFREHLAGYSYYPARSPASEHLREAHRYTLEATAAINDRAFEDVLLSRKEMKQAHENAQAVARELEEVYDSRTFKVGRALLRLPIALKDAYRNR